MQSREQLFHVLAEAAELEHNLLCSYLFAAFSLKQSVAEDLTTQELAVVSRWRKNLIGICIEEMVHLAQVSNLLVAVGARPHFNRPNLPVAPGYHPASIVIELAPFDLATMEHFIFLERPEEAPVTDPCLAAAAAPQPERNPSATWLMPSAPDYETVGEFYKYLREGLAQLTARLGEAQLFCGGSRHQLRGKELNTPDLIVVTDLGSAQAAIDFIVEQGEGSPGHHESSHFQRFSLMREECLRLTAHRAGFRGHRCVARNPVMRPPTEADRVHVTAAAAAAVLDAANAAYGVMLRCLIAVYEVPWGAKTRRKALLGAAIASMHALTALACELTQLPAQESAATPCAGVSFAMLRSIEGFTGDCGSAHLLAERLRQVAAQIAELGLGGTAPPITASIAKAAAALEAAGSTSRNTMAR